MNAFRFPLQKVLDWRRTQLDMEEARLKQQIAALAGLERERSDLEAEGQRAETELRRWGNVAGADLAALGSFRLSVKAREREIEARHAQRQEAMKEQQARMLEARRRFRLLEKLKERRWTEWQAAQARELEELASDSYLAQWNRRES
jgi:flagellar export protein FliJ